jgi:hypothetical protein
LSHGASLRGFTRQSELFAMGTIKAVIFDLDGTLVNPVNAPLWMGVF